MSTAHGGPKQPAAQAGIRPRRAGMPAPVEPDLLSRAVAKVGPDMATLGAVLHEGWVSGA